MENILTEAVKFMASNSGVGTYCILSQKELDGTLTSSPITAAKINGMEEVFFGTGLGSNKVARITADPRVSVCFASDDGYVTLNGIMEVLIDPKVKKAVWYEGLENHFTGPEDAGYCVLRLTTREYKMMIDWQEVRGVLAQSDRGGSV